MAIPEARTATRIAARMTSRGGAHGDPWGEAADYETLRIGMLTLFHDLGITAVSSAAA